MILAYKGKYPKISESAFIAPNATIIGDVEICDGASIWYGAVLRGDMAPIKVGVNSNVQDNCTVHTDTGKPSVIGSNVTIGHNAVIHGCTIEDNCLVGISATVLNDAFIRKGSMIAAGSLIKEKTEIGPRQLAAGVPATIKKEFGEEIIRNLENHAKHYVEMAEDHKKNIK